METCRDCARRNEQDRSGAVHALIMQLHTHMYQMKTSAAARRCTRRVTYACPEKVGVQRNNSTCGWPCAKQRLVLQSCQLHDCSLLQLHLQTSQLCFHHALRSKGQCSIGDGVFRPEGCNRSMKAWQLGQLMMPEARRNASLAASQYTWCATGASSSKQTCYVLILLGHIGLHAWHAATIFVPCMHSRMQAVQGTSPAAVQGS